MKKISVISLLIMAIICIDSSRGLAAYKGNLLGVRYNLSANKSELGEINPSNGTFNIIPSLDNMQALTYTLFTIDSRRDKAYYSGRNNSEVNYLYTIDLVTNNATEVQRNDKLVGLDAYLNVPTMTPTLQLLLLD